MITETANRKADNFSGNLEEAYNYCRYIAQDHYENFPVASLFIPRAKRKHFFAAYAFMRTADDFADNESLEVNQRLQLLYRWQIKLDECYKGTAQEPIFMALSETVKECAIPKEYFDNLLNAFKVDLFKNQYQNFDELREYCSFSANPVGRIVLDILGYGGPSQQASLYSASDSICTGLQLANHWQDVFVDRRKGRSYLPQEEMERFGYSHQDWEREVINASFKALMAFQVRRAREIFLEGRQLLRSLKRPERYEIILIWLGGMRILEKLEHNQYDVLNHRPTINTADIGRMLFRLITLRY